MDNSLSYGSHLWNSYNVVESQSSDSRAFLKRLHTFLRDKSELDHQYAKSLRKLVDKLALPEASGEDIRTFELFLSSFKNLNNLVSQSFDTAATKTEEQVARPLVSYQDTHKRQTKSLEDEIAKAQKSLAAYQEALDSAKQQCRRACEELQRVKENPQTDTGGGNGGGGESPDAASAMALPSTTDTVISPTPEPKKRFNLFKRDGGNKFLAAMTNTMHTMANNVNVQSIGHKTDLPTLTERALAADNKYIAAVKAMRSYRPQYDQHINHLFDSLQQQEEEMRTTSTDLLANYLTLQSALYNQNIENLTAVGQVLGKVSPNRDSQLFIRNNKLSGENKLPPLPVYEMFRGHPQFIEGGDNNDRNDSDNHADPQSTTDTVNGSDVVRFKTSKLDVEEERNYQRIMAEQVLTLFVDKVTGYATDKANTSSDHTTKKLLPAQSLDAEEKTVASRLFQTNEGRVAFASVVNLQRNKGQLHLSLDAYNYFGELVLLFLDSAQAAMHVAPIQLVMILSQSLWRDAVSTDSDKERAKNKVFLSKLIKDHSVWRDERFWEESFFDAFKSKLTEDQVRVHKWHSDSEQRESMHARKQAAFATLSTFAMNMAEFGMLKQQIDSFVEKQAHLNDLDGEQIEMLRMMDHFGHSRTVSMDDSGTNAATAVSAHGVNVTVSDNNTDGHSQAERIESPSDVNPLSPSPAATRPGGSTGDSESRS